MILHSVSVESISTFHCGCKKMKILLFFSTPIWIELTTKVEDSCSISISFKPQNALCTWSVLQRKSTREENVITLFFTTLDDLHTISLKLQVRPRNEIFLCHDLGRKVEKNQLLISQSQFQDFIHHIDFIHCSPNAFWPHKLRRRNFHIIFSKLKTRCGTFKAVSKTKRLREIKCWAWANAEKLHLALDYTKIKKISHARLKLFSARCCVTLEHLCGFFDDEWVPWLDF